MRDQLLLATVAALRTEIQNRSSAQQTLISINFTIAGAAGGVALAKEGRLDVLLIVPLLCPLLGHIYVEHARMIRALGDKVKSLYSGNTDVLGGEGADGRFSRWFSVPIFLLFGLAPILALLSLTYHLTPSTHPAQSLLWVVGAVAVVMFFIASLRVFEKPSS